MNSHSLADVEIQTLDKKHCAKLTVCSIEDAPVLMLSGLLLLGRAWISQIGSRERRVDTVLFYFLCDLFLEVENVPILELVIYWPSLSELTYFSL